METIGTHTRDLMVGDVILDRGELGRVVRVNETHTPGTWSVALDIVDEAPGGRQSSQFVPGDTVWQVAPSAHTVHSGDVVHIGAGSMTWTVRGLNPDGRARLVSFAGGRRLRSVAIDRLVHVSKVERVLVEAEESAAQAEVEQVRDQVVLVVELRAAAAHATTNAAMTSNRERADMYRAQASLFTRAADAIVDAPVAPVADAASWQVVDDASDVDCDAVRELGRHDMHLSTPTRSRCAACPYELTRG